jgi:hypothetical protein
MSEALAPREVIARAIYDQRPFRTAMSGSPMDPFLRESKVFGWDEAPSFYQEECYELADAIMARLLLSDHVRLLDLTPAARAA